MSNRDPKLTRQFSGPEASRRALEEEIDLQKTCVLSLRDSLESKEKEVEHYKSETKKLGETVQKLQRERDDLTQRLSRELSTKLGMEETSIENISIKNRPIKVAEDYTNFCSNSWLLAKDALDAGFEGSNEEMIGMLREVLLEIHDIATGKYKELTNKIYEMITIQAELGAAKELDSAANPLLKMDRRTPEHPDFPDKATIIEKMYKSIPDGLKLSISDFLRATCDTTDIEGLVKDLSKRFMHTLTAAKTVTAPRILKREESFHTLTTTIGKTKEDGLEDINKYIHDCARLSWKMAAQRPPMTFDDKTGVGEKWLGDKHQEVYYNSKDPQDPENVVLYYVYPALKHKDYVMKIGTVFTGPKQKVAKSAEKDIEEDDK